METSMGRESPDEAMVSVSVIQVRSTLSRASSLNTSLCCGVGTSKMRTERSGEMVRIPPHVPHSVEALEDTVAVDLFSPRREDWIRGDDAYLRR
jgi:hypothetical protein